LPKDALEPVAQAVDGANSPAGGDPSSLPDGPADSIAMADLDEAIPQVVHADELCGLSAKLNNGATLRKLRSLAMIVLTFAAAKRNSPLTMKWFIRNCAGGWFISLRDEEAGSSTRDLGEGMIALSRMSWAEQRDLQAILSLIFTAS
jgi:hypothetical protein